MQKCILGRQDCVQISVAYEILCGVCVLFTFFFLFSSFFFRFFLNIVELKFGGPARQISRIRSQLSAASRFSLSRSRSLANRHLPPQICIYPT